MSPPRDLRQMLDRGLSKAGRKAVWREAIGGDDGTARRELDKYLDGERGATLWKIINAGLKFVDREELRAWAQEIASPPDPALMLEAIGKQLPLIFEDLELATELLRDARKVAKLEDYRNRSSG